MEIRYLPVKYYFEALPKIESCLKMLLRQLFNFNQEYDLMLHDNLLYFRRAVHIVVDMQIIDIVG